MTLKGIKIHGSMVTLRRMVRANLTLRIASCLHSLNTCAINSFGARTLKVRHPGTDPSIIECHAQIYNHLIQMGLGFRVQGSGFGIDQRLVPACRSKFRVWGVVPAKKLLTPRRGHVGEDSVVEGH